MTATMKKSDNRVKCESCKHRFSSKAHNGVCPKCQHDHNPPPVKEVVKITSHRNGSAFTDRRPGVVAAMAEILMNRTEENPMSRKELEQEMFARFPDRVQNALRNTIGVKLYIGLTNRKFDLRSVQLPSGRKGYWIAADLYVPGERKTRIRKSKEESNGEPVQKRQKKTETVTPLEDLPY